MQRESDTNETQNLQKQIKQFSFVCLIYIHDRGGYNTTAKLFYSTSNTLVIDVFSSSDLSLTWNLPVSVIESMWSSGVSI